MDNNMNNQNYSTAIHVNQAANSTMTDGSVLDVIKISFVGAAVLEWKLIAKGGTIGGSKKIAENTKVALYGNCMGNYMNNEPVTSTN